jgi:hypothetical protein
MPTPTNEELTDAVNRNTASVNRLEESLNTFNRWVATFIGERERQHVEEMGALVDALERLRMPWWKRWRLKK